MVALGWYPLRRVGLVDVLSKSSYSRNSSRVIKTEKLKLIVGDAVARCSFFFTRYFLFSSVRDLFRDSIRLAQRDSLGPLKLCDESVNQFATTYIHRYLHSCD